MVIRLVAHGDLLFLDFPPQLSVHPLSHRSGGRYRVVTKDLTQMVEQSGGRQEHIGPAHLIEVLQKEVGVLISLFRRFIEIRPGPLPVLFDILSGEVQLSKSVLGVLVSVFGGVGEISSSMVPTGSKTAPGIWPLSYSSCSRTSRMMTSWVSIISLASSWVICW